MFLKEWLIFLGVVLIVLMADTAKGAMAGQMVKAGESTVLALGGRTTDGRRMDWRRKRTNNGGIEERLNSRGLWVDQNGNVSGSKAFVQSDNKLKFNSIARKDAGSYYAPNESVRQGLARTLYTVEVI